MNILRLPNYGKAPNSKVTLNLRHPQARGLVGCWSTFGHHGGLLQDFSPYRNHAAPTANPIHVKDADLGSMLDYTRSSSQYSRIPNRPHLTALDNLTVSTWVRVESINAGDQSIIVGHWDQTPTTCEWLLYLELDGKFRANVYSGVDLNGPTATLGQLYHLAFTYDLTTVNLYIDGTYYTGGVRSRASQSSDSDLSIASRIGDGSIDKFFDGKIDDVRIYNYVLSAEEIHRIYDRQTRFDIWTPIYYPRPLIGPTEVDLIVRNLSQANTISKPSLIKNLDVANLSQSNTSDVIDLRAIYPKDISQANTIDKIALTQVHVLQVENLSQSNIVDKPTLVEAILVTIENLSQDNTVEHIDLHQVPTLSIRNLSQDNLIEHVTTEHTYWLSIGNLSQVNTVEVPWVNTHIQMYVSNLSQANSFPATTLTQIHNLGIYDLSQINTTPPTYLWDWWYETHEDIGLATLEYNVVGYIEQLHEEYGIVDMEEDQNAYVDQILEGDGEVGLEIDLDADIALTHEQDGEL